MPRSTSHDRHLDLVDVEITTCARYESVIRLHVRPLLRSLPVAKLTGETGDAFQAASALPRALRRSSVPLLEGLDDCADLAPARVPPVVGGKHPKINICLGGALARAVRGAGSRSTRRRRTSTGTRISASRRTRGLRSPAARSETVTGSRASMNSALVTAWPRAPHTGRSPSSAAADSSPSEGGAPLSFDG